MFEGVNGGNHVPPIKYQKSATASLQYLDENGTKVRSHVGCSDRRQRLEDVNGSYNVTLQGFLSSGKPLPYIANVALHVR